VLLEATGDGVRQTVRLRTKETIMKRIALWVVLAGTIGAMAWAALGAPRAQTATVLPEAVQDALLQALTGPEGEYAAYASYAAVLDAYGTIEPYATIAVAELRHIDALERLFDTYGIRHPEVNPYLGTIEAPADLAAAAAAWAEGEIANVALYDELLPVVMDYPNITRVFTNLQAASRDAHLPAFQRAAENGGTLTPGAAAQETALPCQGRAEGTALRGRGVPRHPSMGGCRADSVAASESCSQSARRQGNAS